jgi:hypothetical protein
MIGFEQADLQKRGYIFYCLWHQSHVGSVRKSVTIYISLCS